VPKPFGTMRMTTKSELLYGALFLLIALIARSVAMSMSANILRDAVSMLSVVMLIGGVIVVIVGLWHAASRAENPTSMTAPNVPGWFPDHDDATLLRYWDGSAWNGDTARRETTQVQP
jgi:sugar phosphate permease